MEPIQLDRISAGYGHQSVIRNLSLELPAGSLTALVGANGTGKSTLLDVIAGLRKPCAGRIAGFNPHNLAYLPQQTRVDRGFPLQIKDLVASGLWRGLGPWRRASRHQCALVRDAIDAVALTGLERRTIGTLSGGQLQRALFARVLVQQAGVILLDEPFAGVDAATTHHLLHLLNGWHQEGRTLLVVNHDLDQVQRHFPKTLLLTGSQALYGATAEVLAHSVSVLWRGAA